MSFLCGVYWVQVGQHQVKTKITIKRFVDNESLTWEERFKLLQKHHEEESKFLADTIEKLESELEISGSYGVHMDTELARVQKELDAWESHDCYPRDGSD